MFKYDEVPDVTTDYCGGQDCFVGIAAVLNNDTGEYREVMEVLDYFLLVRMSSVPCAG